MMGSSCATAMTLSATTCAMLCALIAAAPVHAQNNNVHTRVVLGGGVSFAGDGPATNGGAGLAGHIGLRHQRRNYVFGARAGMNGGGTYQTTLAGGLRDRFDEIAALVGYAVHRSETAQVVLSTGLAAVSGERVEVGPGGGASNAPFDTRIGLPLQVALSSPAGRSGLGLVVHANLNAEEAFGAITATYLIGFGRR